MSKIYDGDEKVSTPSTLGRIRVNDSLKNQNIDFQISGSLG